MNKINIIIARPRPGMSWRNDAAPCIVIIEVGPVTLGNLIRENAYRLPNDAVWLVDTIGL